MYFLSENQKVLKKRAINVRWCLENKSLCSIWNCIKAQNLHCSFSEQCTEPGGVYQNQWAQEPECPFPPPKNGSQIEQNLFLQRIWCIKMCLPLKYLKIFRRYVTNLELALDIVLIVFLVSLLKWLLHYLHMQF